jgi:hypothetical protein
LRAREDRPAENGLSSEIALHINVDALEERLKLVEMSEIIVKIPVCARWIDPRLCRTGRAPSLDVAQRIVQLIC